MNANLVGASSLKFAGHQGHRSLDNLSVGQDFDVGGRGLAVGHHHSHLLAISGVAPNVTGDGLVFLHVTPGQSQVLPRDGPGLQLTNQRGLGLWGFGHHHQARRIAIEPMHDAGAGQLNQIGVKVQQAVEQGATGVARRRVDHQTGRLVDHQKARLIVYDFKVDRLGLPVTLRLRGRFQDLDDIPKLECGAGPWVSISQRDKALLHPFLQTGPRVLRQTGRQEAIQALALVLGGDDKAHRLAIIGDIFLEV